MSLIYQALLEQVQQQPDKTAVILGDNMLSYQQLLAQTNQWTAILTERFSLQNKRLRLAWLCENPINITTFAFAVARLNGCCIPTNPQLTAQQLIHVWQSAKPNIIFYDKKFEHKITPFIEQGIDCLCIEEAIADTDVTFTEQHFSAAVNNQVAKYENEPDYIITLSSGSTGTPKPICLSQRAKLLRAKQSWELYQVTEQDVCLSASPFFHSLGQRLTFVPLLKGCTLVFLPQYTPKQWVAQVVNHRVNFTIAVSSHLYGLKTELLNKQNALSSLRCIVSSSAPIDSHFKQQLFEQLGCEFHEMYGATEIATATNLPPKDAQIKYQSVGQPCPEVDICILDEAQRKLGPHQIGEIAIKTPLAFAGYYQQTALTKQAWFQEYFLTGDLGKLDEDGYLHYVARKKDIIISGGINIYPSDIEHILLTHPKVTECAVIGVKDRFFGEVVIAVCVAPNSPSIQIELMQLALKELAPFQRPIKYFLVDNLPKTPSGKLSKLQLREYYNNLNEDWSANLRAMMFNN